MADEPKPSWTSQVLLTPAAFTRKCVDCDDVVTPPSLVKIRCDKCLEKKSQTLYALFKELDLEIGKGSRVRDKEAELKCLTDYALRLKSAPFCNACGNYGPAQCSCTTRDQEVTIARGFKEIASSPLRSSLQSSSVATPETNHQKDSLEQDRKRK